jgi:hypothetical protein
MDLFAAKRAGLLAVCLAILAGPAFAQVPARIHQEGLLVDVNGAPLEGPVDLTVALFANAGGGQAVWTESFRAVPLVEGYYSLLLGETTPFDEVVVGRGSYLELSVGNRALAPRTRLVSVPAAALAPDSHARRVRAPVAERAAAAGADPLAAAVVPLVLFPQGVLEAALQLVEIQALHRGQLLGPAPATKKVPRRKKESA